MSSAKIDWLRSALLTDLYQLIMLQGYLDRGMTDTAVFEFFVRRLPAKRNFLLAAGLEQALEYLVTVRFSEYEIEQLRKTGLFGEEALSYFREFRFTGDVDAMPEGTAYFANEPILRVRAPLPEAQFVESRLINILHFQSLIASKAARCVLAAPDKLLVDFGMRRAHGGEAAILAARASYLAGFSGTATVIAEPLFGVPLYGTMAHSFIQAHDTEVEAFEHFAESHRGAVVLLIDTYDTEVGAYRVVELARRLEGSPVTINAVRLDSGDLIDLSRRVRRILDDGGSPDIRIFASGNVDEYALEAMLAAEAPIDGYGIGTNLDVSEDSPSLDCAYKIQEYAGRARRKRSTGKATLPGSKQVYRQYDDAGQLRKDIITVEGDEQPGEPLLEPVMRDGRLSGEPMPLRSLREHALSELARLPGDVRSLTQRSDYPVEVSTVLEALAHKVDQQFH